MWRFFTRREEVPQILDSLDLDGVVKYIQSDACKNIFVMAGAGISTSAGIPDFRSPDTGLYANLARLRLPYPEAVFDISFFKKNPRPFYVLAHELAPGKFRPTLTHSFIRLLSEKGYLHTCFTQNIDTLERRAGVPGEKIIEAHGSFANQHCVKCGAPYAHDKIKQKIENQEIPVCEEPGCNGYVKPDIVFFGESLPDEFSNGIRNLTDADLLICMGTSLTVYPFAKLTELVPEDCPRLLINLDHVGGWGSRVNDVACLMPCDEAVRELCRKLGWEEELDRLWAETATSTEGPAATETAEEKLGEVVEELAEVIGTDESKEAAEGEVNEIVEELAVEIEAVKLDVTEEVETNADKTKDDDSKPAAEEQAAESPKVQEPEAVKTGEEHIVVDESEPESKLHAKPEDVATTNEGEDEGIGKPEAKLAASSQVAGPELVKTDEEHNAVGESKAKSKLDAKPEVTAITNKGEDQEAGEPKAEASEKATAPSTEAEKSDDVVSESKSSDGGIPEGKL